MTSSSSDFEKYGSSYLCFSMTLSALKILITFFSQASLLNSRFRPALLTKISAYSSSIVRTKNLMYIDSCFFDVKPKKDAVRPFLELVLL